MPLVSVCVPVYNGEKYIKKTLETIINQTWRDFELIISDDGSKDNTLAIIQEFNDDRIIINRNPVNLGQAGNINKLIELAQGEYIAIYHADDLYEPDILEKEVNFLNKHPEAVAVFAMYDQIDSKDNKINEVRLPEKVSSKDAFNMDEAIDNLIKYETFIFCCPTLVSRRDIYKKAGMYRSGFRSAQDLDMFTRMLQHGAIGIINEKLLNYRRTTGQVSSSYSLTMTEENEFFKILGTYVQQRINAGTIGKDIVRAFRVRRQVDMSVRMMNLMKLGQVKEARTLYCKSISFYRIIYSFSSRLSLFSLVASTLLFLSSYLGLGKKMGEVVFDIRVSMKR